MKAPLLKIALTLLFLIAPSLASAGTQHNMAGYAWSSNIGWVSFNCTNNSSCGTADYGVNRNGDGTLSGYAWSPNIGWIQFGGLSGFPAGSGTYAQNAQVNGTTVRGWAKALSAGGSAWDGWISFSGSAPAYGINLIGTSFSGFAWGSTVVGWLSFSCVDTSSCGAFNYGVVLTGDATLDVKSGGTSLSGNSAVPFNTIPTFEWTLTNISSATCALTKTAGGTSFTPVTGITSSGSVTGNALIEGAHTYSLDCTNPTISKQISFTVAPQPPGFSLGAAETAKIQFLAAGSADSQIKTLFVSPVGGFSDPVTIRVSGVSPAVPAGTTFTYSLGGSAFSANPAVVTISNPYNSGTTIQVRVSKKITSQYTVTLTGSGGGVNATKEIIVDPTAFDPKFEER